MTLALLGSLLAASPPGHASGFAIFDQDAAATGMGGAATARYDSASSLFYNVGAAAFLKKPAFAFGAVYRTGQSLSLVPVPEAGETAVDFEPGDPSGLLGHAYAVLPLREKLNWGVAVYSPFDHDLAHPQSDAFPGRATSVSSTIRTLDASLNLAGRFGDNFGVGIGAVARASSLRLVRRLQTADPLDPSSNLDFASLENDSDADFGFGLTFGFLHRASTRFAWGMSYRSRIEIDYSGSATLTQVPTGNDQLDELLALTNPFDQDLPMISRIEFPDHLALGIGVRLSDALFTAIDVGSTGWSSVDRIAFQIPSFPTFGNQVRLDLDDALSLRAGLELTLQSGTQWRIGYAFEESSQPDGELSPFFLDSDSNVVSLGLGKDWLQVAVQWRDEQTRSAFSDDLSAAFGGDSFRISITLRKKPEL